MRLNNKVGAVSAKLIFVVIAGVGVMVLLFSLARSEKFETVQVNLSVSQQNRADQLREMGQLEESPRLDGKLLLNQYNLEKYNKERNSSCDYLLNISSPKETAVFKSKEKAISFSLPYSDLWGSDEFAVMPFDELETAMFFGPLLEMPNCAWQRAYSMIVHETAPTTEILADLAMRNIEGDWEFSKVKDRDIIKFVEKNASYANCSSVRIYLLGLDYDYEFVVACSDDLANDFSFLEQILLTVKFD